ncbi:unnamed protein product, partial [Didymodactylos carnosus]
RVPAHPNVYRWIEEIRNEEDFARCRDILESDTGLPSKKRRKENEENDFALCLAKTALTIEVIDINEYLEHINILPQLTIELIDVINSDPQLNYPSLSEHIIHYIESTFSLLFSVEDNTVLNSQCKASIQLMKLYAKRRSKKHKLTSKLYTKTTFLLKTHDLTSIIQTTVPKLLVPPFSTIIRIPPTEVGEKLKLLVLLVSSPQFSSRTQQIASKLLPIGLSKMEDETMIIQACDYKMLLILFGLNAVSGTHFCPWCKVNRSTIKELGRFSGYDTKRGARSMAEVDNEMKKSEKKRQYGCKRYSIFGDRFSFQDARPDLFHFEHRIHDIFMKHILGLINESYDMDNIKEVEQILHELHSISKDQRADVKFEMKNGNLEVKGRCTNGMERNFFRDIPLSRVLYNKPQQTLDIMQLIQNFYQLLSLYSERNSNQDYFVHLKQASIMRVKQFARIFGYSYVTPYVHVLCDHMSEFQEKDEDDELSCFNLQGAEKYNDLSTADYFRSTNKHHNSLEQMIKKSDFNNTMFYWTQIKPELYLTTLILIFLIIYSTI